VKFRDRYSKISVCTRNKQSETWTIKKNVFHRVTVKDNHLEFPEFLLLVLHYNTKESFIINIYELLVLHPAGCDLSSNQEFNAV
jgi:hypothetical protein